MGQLRDHYPPRVSGLLETRCHIRAVADRCVIHSKIASNASHDHQTCVDTLSYFEINPPPPRKFVPINSQGLLDPERCTDGPLRMVLMRDRSTKESHNAV